MDEYGNLLMHEVPGIFRALVIGIFSKTVLHPGWQIVRQSFSIDKQNDGYAQFEDEKQSNEDDVLKKKLYDLSIRDMQVKKEPNPQMYNQ